MRARFVANEVRGQAERGLWIDRGSSLRSFLYSCALVLEFAEHRGSRGRFDEKWHASSRCSSLLNLSIMVLKAGLCMCIFAIDLPTSYCNVILARG